MFWRDLSYTMPQYYALQSIRFKTCKKLRLWIKRMKTDCTIFIFPLLYITIRTSTYILFHQIDWMYNFGQLTAFSIVVDLWSGHPNTLNDLEHRRSNHNEDEQCYKLWRYRVLLLFLRCFTNITTFGNVLLVLFISLFHSWRGRHFDFVYWCLWKIYVKHKWFWKKWVYIRFKARCLKVSCWISDMLCQIVETKPI